MKGDLRPQWFRDFLTYNLTITPQKFKELVEEIVHDHQYQVDFRAIERKIEKMDEMCLYKSILEKYY